MLKDQDREEDRSLIRAVRILVQGIGQHATADDVDDCQLFRESINALSDELADGMESEKLLVAVGAVLKTLEDHTRHTAKRQSLQTTELKNMVKMLTSTVADISALSTTNISVLGEIEKQVAGVSELNDIRLVKSKLSDCLTEIKKESERQMSEATETIVRLNSELAKANQRFANSNASPEKDGITQMSTRREAEAAISAWPSGTRGFVALFVADSLQVLNQRFGRDVGDEILAAFSGMLKSRFKTPDHLFRWGGPAFLVLLSRPGALEEVRNEVTRLFKVTVEYTVQSRSLSILIPLTTRWAVFPVTSAPRLMFQKLDLFAGGPSPRE